jgi:hypothetical protein
MAGVQFLAGCKWFFSSLVSRLAQGPIQPDIHWVPGALSLGLKCPGFGTYPSPLSSAEVTNAAWQMEIYYYESNWKGSLGYKLAIYLTKLLKHTMHLPSVYNVQNSATLMHDLEQITIHPNIRTCSFDLTNMYTNIPIKELINIIQKSLTHNHIPN